MRGRGSKRVLCVCRAWKQRRPPCEGVDRNFRIKEDSDKPPLSPSVRGRGSKLDPAGAGAHPCRRSPSVRGRGSKQQPRAHPGWFRGCRPPCEGVDRNSVPVSTSAP
ncbi:protein of unknown function (plasmid) [Rhodovastum atsumiense]|nr:protein of unknown function [Rhodovastum atsumiense]